MTIRESNSKQTYDFKRIENRWRPYWRAIGLYQTGSDPQKPNKYILDFFPYPSGAGLSVGHCRNYIPTCASARYYRMNGYNVLHPMGWDAFGLPAENYAIDHGVHPRDSSAEFAATYKRQMQLIECSYDWSREFSSTDPAFYHWTQWFFTLLFKRDLAYRAKGNQWWCPVGQTILANEQVIDGRCWRHDVPVSKVALDQWYFRITDYADRLLQTLDDLDWPEGIKAMQRNWIGRSEGVEIDFVVGDQVATVFTTRPDTLFGATYLVLAAEHPLVERITTEGQADEVRAYVEDAQRVPDIERTAAGRSMTGVFSGAMAIHPLTGRRLPVWIADYVLMDYGSGAIMGVPAHDQRDYAFALIYRLPVLPVVLPDALIQDRDALPYSGHGRLINSSKYNGLPSQEGGQQITAALVEKRLGRPRVSYRMRDWLISRQRYWGAPIPIIHCPKCGAVPVPEEELPVLLPDTDDFAPSGDGRSPLARIESWVNVPCPACGEPGRREVDTMDGFACSSWYFLRFASPNYPDGPFEQEAMRRWLPVDTYVGGAEHAVMHLLYARFWTKVMFDAGLVPFEEPFTELRNQGQMLSAVDGRRMSKSRGNVVTPDEVVAQHGVDALRTYILFLGPFDTDVTWDDRGISGVKRFLNRYWRWAHTDPAPPDTGESAHSGEFERRRHEIIQRVTHDFEEFRFNTAVAALMEYLNDLIEFHAKGVVPDDWRRALETFTVLLCPIAPFICEEVWQGPLRQTDSVHRQSWPVYDEEEVQAPEVTIIVQVNGRVRDRFQYNAGAGEAALRQAALARQKVRGYLEDQEIERVVVVPDRLVNIVV